MAGRLFDSCQTDWRLFLSHRMLRNYKRKGSPSQKCCSICQALPRFSLKTLAVLVGRQARRRVWKARMSDFLYKQLPTFLERKKKVKHPYNCWADKQANRWLDAWKAAFYILFFDTCLLLFLCTFFKRTSCLCDATTLKCPYFPN